MKEKKKTRKKSNEKNDNPKKEVKVQEREKESTNEVQVEQKIFDRTIGPKYKNLPRVCGVMLCQDENMSWRKK